MIKLYVKSLILAGNIINFLMIHAGQIQWRMLNVQHENADHIIPRVRFVVFLHASLQLGVIEKFNSLQFKKYSYAPLVTTGNICRFKE